MAPSGVMFEACLSLPHDRREALLLAEQFDALARALRDWPVEAWRAVAQKPLADGSGLFERLIARTAPLALKPTQRQQAEQSAAAVADVLRVLWPESAPAGSRVREPELVTAVS